MEYIKKDETTLEATKSVETKEEVNEYKLDFLKKQEVNILKQKNDFVETRDLELLEIRELIAKCEELGVKSEIEVKLAEETAKEIIK
ncbi:MAG: hypothetical protein COX19_14120 [Desulfobacterales bacterium CG23_combo_of_CG06-09_8_20_14_all_51_8]|nr:MAG: hypothetical protein COX19_14120 [Desulfobacterales bacterium CG23_combo_of_CG06-09_8_20_14_all_51_8]